MQYDVQYTLINRDPDHSENKSSYTYLYFLCSPRQLIKKICVRACTLWKYLFIQKIPYSFYFQNFIVVDMLNAR